ncbi:hypothetical protein [Herbaspirillum huttiense]|uniref:hypothetical protein n=2 Tax=Pseudomonadota TaxID=1224 RepID=UPI000585AE77|nr:hypothetical protein [Herbaspirillum huttiense]
MSASRTWLLAAGTLLLTTACSTPEERMAKLQIKQQRLEIKAQQAAQRNEARNELRTKVQASAVTDQRGPYENVIKALASCDASFAATLRQFSGSLPPAFVVTLKGPVASIDVPDRRTPGSNRIAAAGSAQAYGQTLSGYYDERTESNGQLQKMSWGFYSPATPEQLAKVLGAAIPNFKRTSRELDGNYVRMEIFDRGGWHRTTRFDYYRGQSNVLGERTLVIEPSRDPSFPGSRIGCSVRGAQVAQFQDELRPEVD